MPTYAECLPYLYETPEGVMSNGVAPDSCSSLFEATRKYTTKQPKSQDSWASSANFEPVILLRSFVGRGRDFRHFLKPSKRLRRPFEFRHYRSLKSFARAHASYVKQFEY